jgi:hypothetical protein
MSAPNQNVSKQSGLSIRSLLSKFCGHVRQHSIKFAPGEGRLGAASSANEVDDIPEGGHRLSAVDTINVRVEAPFFAPAKKYAPIFDKLLLGRHTSIPTLKLFNLIFEAGVFFLRFYGPLSERAHLLLSGRKFVGNKLQPLSQDAVYRNAL